MRSGQVSKVASFLGHLQEQVAGQPAVNLLGDFRAPLTDSSGDLWVEGRAVERMTPDASPSAFSRSVSFRPSGIVMGVISKNRLTR